MLSTRDSMLLVIDMQEKLLPAIEDVDRLVLRASHLAQAARLLGVPVWATEHWPEKIGATHAGILAHVDHMVAKTHFDGCREPGFTDALPRGRGKVLLLGTEAHICVLQTGLGLASAGYEPILVSDCVGSRRAADREAAIQRWHHYGLESVTLEMAMFEWLETPSHPKFREVLALVK